MFRLILLIGLLFPFASYTHSAPWRNELPEPLQPTWFQAMAAGKVSEVFIDDRAFLRRLWLDLAGTLPESSRVNAFIADRSASKYASEIEFIMQSEIFTDRWTTFFGDLFQNFALLENSATYRNAFDDQLRSMVAANMPWNQMAQRILTGKGRGDSPDATMFFWSREAFEEVERMDYLDDQAGWISDVFLGMETNCISCHDGAGHLEQVNKGLSQMTRQQFWGFAAFLSSTYLYGPENVSEDDSEAQYFAGLQVGDLDVAPIANLQNRAALSFANDDEMPFDAKLFDGQYHADTRPGQGMRPPRRGGVIEPAYPFTGEKPRAGETRRAALARIITADRQFSRNMVNRIWAHLFGEGFVEPLNGWDPIRVTDAIAAANGLPTQPKNSFLVEFLTDWFMQNQYDLRALMKLIVNSKVYQWNYRIVEPGQGSIDASDRWGYWRDNKRVRRLEAEAIAESYYRVFGWSPQFLVTGRAGKIHQNSWAMPEPMEPSEAIFDTGEEEDDDETPLPATFYGLNTENLIFEMERHQGFLRNFGRGDYFNRISRTQDVSVQNTLHLLNEEFANLWLEEPEMSPPIAAFAAKLRQSSLNEADLITQVYQFILFRDPTGQEVQNLKPHLEGKPAAQAVADLFWALINHPDFIYK